MQLQCYAIDEYFNKKYSLIMIEKYCRIADEFSTIISLC